MRALFINPNDAAVAGHIRRQDCGEAAPLSQLLLLLPPSNRSGVLFQPIDPGTAFDNFKLATSARTSPAAFQGPLAYRRCIGGYLRADQRVPLARDKRAM